MREADQRPSHETDQGSIYLDWVKALTGSADTPEEAVLARCNDARERVSRLRDPFMPIARNDPGARDDEKVLWEDEAFLVISDTFSGGAKALVIPTREANFPIDLAPEERARMELVTREVSRAFQDVTGHKARAWVNVPGALSVRQLHAHVLPQNAPKAVTEDQVAQLLAARLQGEELSDG